LKRLQCVALHCDHNRLTEENASAVQAAGYGLLCWTVNDAVAARRLLGWGVDCLVTDALRAITADFA
jgi:glycerophosphoryl diester phosphodiesterase